MNPHNPSQSNRFAEIALELFGSKAAIEFVQQAWDVASPEAKQALADQIVATVAVQIKDGNYFFDVRNMLHELAYKFAREIFDAKGYEEKLRAGILASLEKEMPAAFEIAAKEAARKAWQEACYSIGRKIDK